LVHEGSKSAHYENGKNLIEVLTNYFLRGRRHNYDDLWRSLVIFKKKITIVPDIPSPKHHEIQEFGKNYHISTMKIN
jgi:hypothetical protein